MSALKRLKVEEKAERISWRNPQFADWKLCWGGSDSAEMKSWQVHRCVLIGGTRPAHFFAGAAREGVYDSRSTDLSALLPEACKCYIERTLDFIYGETLGEIDTENVMPLLKIADVLQCPHLQNCLIDYIESTSLGKAGAIETLLKDACVLDLFAIAETLVSLMPVNRLMSLNFDVLEVNSLRLMRAVAQRIAQSNLSQWGSFAGHGVVSEGGGLSISLANSPGEKSRKGYWCYATGVGEALVGQHRWKLRIDHVPPGGYAAWNIVIGVVSGAASILSNVQLEKDILFVCNFKYGAYLDFNGADDWRISSRSDDEDHWTSYVDAISAPRRDWTVRKGDIVSLDLNLHDGKSMGVAEWRLNGNIVGTLQNLKPAPYRLCAELFKYDYEHDTIGLSLLSHMKE